MPHLATAIPTPASDQSMSNSRKKVNRVIDLVEPARSDKAQNDNFTSNKVLQMKSLQPQIIDLVEKEAGGEVQASNTVGKAEETGETAAVTDDTRSTAKSPSKKRKSVAAANTCAEDVAWPLNVAQPLVMNRNDNDLKFEEQQSGSAISSANKSEQEIAKEATGKAAHLLTEPKSARKSKPHTIASETAVNLGEMTAANVAALGAEFGVEKRRHTRSASVASVASSVSETMHLTQVASQSRALKVPAVKASTPAENGENLSKGEVVVDVEVSARRTPRKRGGSVVSEVGDLTGDDELSERKDSKSKVSKTPAKSAKDKAKKQRTGQEEEELALQEDDDVVSVSSRTRTRAAK